jgi:hypothetical protein
VRRNVLRTAKDVHEINMDWNVNEPPIDLLPKYLRRLRIVNRHWKNLKARGL